MSFFLENLINIMDFWAIPMMDSECSAACFLFGQNSTPDGAPSLSDGAFTRPNQQIPIDKIKQMPQEISKKQIEKATRKREANTIECVFVVRVLCLCLCSCAEKFATLPLLIFFSYVFVCLLACVICFFFVYLRTGRVVAV